jgi:hypothetical protein
MEADNQAANPAEAFAVVPSPAPANESSGQVMATEEEIEAFHLVKAIVRDVVSPSPKPTDRPANRI